MTGPTAAVRPGRELAAACLLTLAGSLVVLLAGRQRWFTPPRGAAPQATTGTELVPLAHALALVALAGVVALLAARGWTRLAVGGALILGGLAIAAVAVTRLGGSLLGPGLTVVGGLLVALAGVLTVVRSRRWPALGARYDAPGRPRTEDAWAALDRGEDPTVG